ncbi:MAG: hypothetical protein H0V17_05170 [Deltaproteobacteria bacterium]|nr:hypothetical protein [Deltaproteobacteria bacterium]
MTTTKTYGHDVIKLARHLAAVVHGKLPATHAVSAITHARDMFRNSVNPAADSRSIVLATQLFVRDILRAEDPTATTRAWLDGEQVEIEVTHHVKAPADGEDPRVKIFERYMPELSDDALLARHMQSGLEPWARDLEQERLRFDDLLIRAFVARLPLPDGWVPLADPAVAAWLGVETSATEPRFRDLGVLRSADRITDEWSDSLYALVGGTQARFRELAEGGKLPKFKPGQFFKDDARKLIRYVASAIGNGAPSAAVLPAWHDFLSRCSPASTPRLTGERVALSWKHLLVIQSAIARLDGVARGEVGRALQHAVSGA